MHKAAIQALEKAAKGMNKTVATAARKSLSKIKK